ERRKRYAHRREEAVPAVHDPMPGRRELPGGQPCASGVIEKIREHPARGGADVRYAVELLAPLTAFEARALPADVAYRSADDSPQRLAFGREDLELQGRAAGVQHQQQSAVSAQGRQTPLCREEREERCRTPWLSGPAAREAHSCWSF